MKLLLCSLACGLMLTSASAEDLSAPKPGTGRPIRVLLHLAGSERLIDYNDVYKLYNCDANAISFETSDGFIVIHRGAYTLIVQKSAASEIRSSTPGERFFDPK